MSLTRRALVAASLPLGLTAYSARSGPSSKTSSIERWGVFELALPGPSTGNPFADIKLSARFTHDDKVVVVPGFYDGDGIYRIRFSPPSEGEWRWTTKSNASALTAKTGSLLARPPGPGNHGPVQVSPDGYHFVHADGTPFNQIGTTAYAWAQQADERVADTLQTLAASPFNKIRMCVFPNVAAEPIEPFVMTGSGEKDWDATRFNPAFFRRFEDRVARLQAIGIEADIIIFHPYNAAHGYSNMDRGHDELYVRYLIARLSAYRNVWWSLANEFDLIKTKTSEDFDHLLQLVQAEDPHQRLRSIHNCHVFYDNRKPWITHSSVQNGSAVVDDTRAEVYRDIWEKPVIFDEICYEGDSEARWGQLSGEDMVSRFWYGTIAGTYVGHSETLAQKADPVTGASHPDASWAGKGGKLFGASAPRLAFLKKVMDDGPKAGIDPIDKWWDRHLGGQPGQFYLRYFGKDTPAQWPLVLPKVGLTGGERFRVDILDTWNMTVTAQAGEFTMAKLNGYDFGDPSRPFVALPGKPWMAVRIIRVA